MVSIFSLKGSYLLPTACQPSDEVGAVRDGSRAGACEAKEPERTPHRIARPPSRAGDRILRLTRTSWVSRALPLLRRSLLQGPSENHRLSVEHEHAARLLGLYGFHDAASSSSVCALCWLCRDCCECGEGGTTAPTGDAGAASSPRRGERSVANGARGGPGGRFAPSWVPANTARRPLG